MDIKKIKHCVLQTNKPSQNFFEKNSECEMCFDKISSEDVFTCDSRYEHAYHRKCLLKWLTAENVTYSCFRCCQDTIKLQISDDTLHDVSSRITGQLIRKKIITEEQAKTLYQERSVRVWKANVPHILAWFTIIGLGRLWFSLLQTDPLINARENKQAARLSPVIAHGLIFLMFLLIPAMFLIIADDEYRQYDKKFFNVETDIADSKVFTDLRKNSNAFLKCLCIICGYLCMAASFSK